ncbi:MAG: DUF4013 domain-containing protein [Methanobrevibacter sp.]|jgi:MFS family permease|uniref:DUF4013 domain-containing protein n=1 Tax=Methanobrevibacter sp. TaxID=66852 RepID=UPI0025E89239|nr:DUF4013 domain-containing protein [Methanobrevibacter sp.]MBE6497722.1 DUF4013 domain-containing protein [Methanobrevibacter sp.]
MELGEIISDALVYPLHNIKALVIYIILGIILGIAIAGTVSGIMFGNMAKNVFAVIGSGTIGIIIALIIGFVITGYELDIIKYGIEKRNDAPGIDFMRQFINGVKYFVVNIVYMIIPIIIGAILAVIFQHWLSGLISIILSIIFSFALMMGQCRLAKTEDLGYALSIGEAVGDLSKVGILKVIVFVILVVVISFILLFVVGLIGQWNNIVGGILMGILGVYLVFFNGRATGLLYSDVN